MVKSVIVKFVFISSVALLESGDHSNKRARITAATAACTL